MEIKGLKGQKAVWIFKWLDRCGQAEDEKTLSKHAQEISISQHFTIGIWFSIEIKDEPMGFFNIFAFKKSFVSRLSFHGDSTRQTYAKDYKNDYSWKH